MGPGDKDYMRSASAASEAIAISGDKAMAERSIFEVKTEIETFLATSI